MTWGQKIDHLVHKKVDYTFVIVSIFLEQKKNRVSSNNKQLTAKFFERSSCFEHTLQLLFMVFLDLHRIGEHLKSEHLVVVKELIIGFLVVPNRLLEIVSERWRFAIEITTKTQLIAE